MPVQLQACRVRISSLQSMSTNTRHQHKTMIMTLSKETCSRVRWTFWVWMVGGSAPVEPEGCMYIYVSYAHRSQSYAMVAPLRPMYICTNTIHTEWSLSGRRGKVGTSSIRCLACVGLSRQPFLAEDGARIPYGNHIDWMIGRLSKSTR